MFEPTIYVLLFSAGATGLLHTLIPDHWLPFVLIGRVRNWTAGATALIAGISALIHVSLAIGLGLLTLGIGLTTAELAGESLQSASAILLVLFGLAYAWWAWRKGGHFHPGGKLLHAHGQVKPRDGGEGNEKPTHLHYHADEDLIRGGADRSALWLAVIVGINPCVLMLPIMLATVGKGMFVFWLVVVTYSLPAILLTIGLSVLGVVGVRRIPVPMAARYMEAASGLLIALLGLCFWIFD